MWGWGLVLGLATLVACGPLPTQPPTQSSTTLAIEWQRGFSVMADQGDVTVEVVVSGEGIDEAEPVTATLNWGQHKLELTLPPGAKQLVGVATDADGNVMAGTSLTVDLAPGLTKQVNLVLRPPRADCTCLPKGKGKALGHDKGKAKGWAWGHYKCLGPCFPDNPPEPTPSPTPSSDPALPSLGTLVANPNPVSGAGYPAAMALTLEGDPTGLSFSWSAQDPYGVEMGSFGDTRVIGNTVYVVWTSPDVTATTDFTVTVAASDGRTATTQLTVIGGTQTGQAGGGY